MMACFLHPSPVPRAHLPSPTGFLTAASTRVSYEGDHHPLPNSASASASASAVLNVRTGFAEMSDSVANKMFADHPEMAMTFLMRSQAEDADRHRGKRARLRDDDETHGTSVCEKTNRRSAFHRQVRTYSRTLALVFTIAILIWSMVRMRLSVSSHLCPAMHAEAAAADHSHYTSAAHVHVTPAAKAALAMTPTTAGAGGGRPSPPAGASGNSSAGDSSAGDFDTYVSFMEANRRGYLSYEQSLSLSGAVHPDTLQAFQEIMRHFEVMKRNDAVDGAYSTWNSMMEVTCQKYAAELTRRDSSEAVTRSSNENRAQLDLMTSEYDALLMSAESHNSLFVHPSNATAVLTAQPDFWSVPKMFAEVLRMSEWDMPCSSKTHIAVFFWFAFIAGWHVLTLEAWLGLRYWRARLWMWRWEMNNRRKTAISVADAKAFALASDAPHSDISDDEVDRPPVRVTIDRR